MNHRDLADPTSRVLPRILQRQAREVGEVDFLIRGDHHVTFAAANRITDSMAAGLAALGVGKGDRVALYLSGRPEAVLLPLAVNKLGAVWVPISTDYRGDWLAQAVIRSRCLVLVTESKLAGHVDSIRPRLGAEQIVVLEDESGKALLEAAPRLFDCSDQHYGDTCAILWTSGTTGRSKAVLQSYNSWLRGIHRAVGPQYETRPGDVIYNVLPLFNTGAWVTSVFRALVEGVTCVLDEPFSVREFWDRIRKYGATQTFTLGAMHMFLWNAPQKPDDADNPLRIAKMIPMPAELEAPFAKRFGIRLLGPGYGQSECPLVTTATDQEAPAGSIGFPMDDTDVRLFDENDREVPTGEVGELRIRPLEPHILFNGYFGDDEATRAAYRGPNGEWYCTGDLARRDEDGAFRFVDRKKDAVRFAGRNISSMEVESVVRRHPAVADAAAFGIPSAEIESEDELKVNVVLAQGASLAFEELASYVNDNAPYYFVPRYLEFVDALPFTPTGKVEKYKLRELGVSEHAWDRSTSGYVVRR
ncbi:MAG: AMP-binding protein [Candidatus Binatia bacterium]|nr:AMP-binding protein [Candidatus Binatia bacterium]